uniref:Uncharacterized protein n=1 Tax=Cacopsylla melanoneura TaxID=428564 RepID=A0A8D9BCV5_9HEMI
MVDATSIKNALTKSEMVWIQRIKKETQARKEFPDKWGWMTQHYEETAEKLKNMKNEIYGIPHTVAVCESSSNVFGQGGPCPGRQGPTKVLPEYPVTTAKEIGWLSTNPAFTLETVGPFPNTRATKIPVHPPGFLPLEDIDFNRQMTKCFSNH